MSHALAFAASNARQTLAEAQKQQETELKLRPMTRADFLGSIDKLTEVETLVGEDLVAAKEAVEAAQLRVNNLCKQRDDCRITLNTVIGRFSEWILDDMVASGRWTLEDVLRASVRIDGLTPMSLRRVGLALRLHDDVSAVEGKQGMFLTQIMRHIAAIASARLTEANVGRFELESPPQYEKLDEACKALRHEFLEVRKWNAYQLISAGDCLEDAVFDSNVRDVYDRGTQLMRACVDILGDKGDNEAFVMQVFRAVIDVPKELVSGEAKKQETEAKTVPGEQQAGTDEPDGQAKAAEPQEPEPYAAPEAPEEATVKEAEEKITLADVHEVLNFSLEATSSDEEAVTVQVEPETVPLPEDDE